MANAVKQSMISGLHGLPRYARSDGFLVQGLCAVSAQIQTVHNDNKFLASASATLMPSTPADKIPPA